jgi:hypothetical protein
MFVLVRCELDVIVSGAEQCFLLFSARDLRPANQVCNSCLSILLFSRSASHLTHTVLNSYIGGVKYPLLTALAQTMPYLDKRPYLMGHPVTVFHRFSHNSEFQLTFYLLLSALVHIPPHSKLANSGFLEPDLYHWENGEFS